MKNINQWFWGMVVLAVVMLGVLMVLPGCASVAPGHDPVVVRAEQVRDVAVTTFDVLLELEYQNSEALWKVSPEIKRTCDYIRKNERLWINGLTSMINAYKKNRTPEGKANLTTALATLESGLQLAQKILSQAKEEVKRVGGGQRTEGRG